MTQDMHDDTPSTVAIAPRPGANLPELSVSELSFALKRTVEDAYGYVRVRGELSQVKRHASGHVYLRLKDETAVLGAVCWRGVAGKLAVAPEDGLEVVCTGKITTYPNRSEYQLVIDSMQLAGVGALLKMLEDRKKRLAAEGLFDEARKRPLPYLPHVIGIITSPTGAVIRDILHRLADRFPRHVLVWPAAMQGEQAAVQVMTAIAGFNALPVGGPIPRPDLLIVARGGGSLEDLMPFNDEALTRAAAASAIPLIAAIGHETDTTLIELAADRRAPTPTAAAEFAVPVRAALLADLATSERRAVHALARTLAERRARLEGLAHRLSDPQTIILQGFQRVDDWDARLRLATAALIQGRKAHLGKAGAGLRHPRELLQAARTALAVETRALDGAFRYAVRSAQQRLIQASGLLKSYSYKGVLERGFAVVRDENGQVISNANDLKIGDTVSLTFQYGELSAQIESKARPTRKAKPDAPKIEQGKLF